MNGEDPETGVDRTQVLLVPGAVRRGAFALRYVTSDGSCQAVCRFDSANSTLATVKSPSGTGKSTLLRRLVYCLGREGATEDDELAFTVTNGAEAPPPISIGVVPQNPPFVRHRKVKSLFPKEPWSAPAAFPDEWDTIRGRLMGQLSGGQQRRLYACSALERLQLSEAGAALLVLDETLDGLGADGAAYFLDKVSEAWQSGSAIPLAFLVVTHLSAISANSVPSVLHVSLAVEDERTDSLSVRVEVHHD